MATKVNFLNASKLLIRLGNGGSPQQFIHPCTINTSRGIEFGSSPTESLIPYCPPDEDLPGWIDRETDSLSASISGAGILDTESLHIFWDWFESGASKDIHVELATILADGGGYFWGAGVLTSFGINGPGRREKTTFDCTIMSDGVWDFAVATS